MSERDYKVVPASYREELTSETRVNSAIGQALLSGETVLVAFTEKEAQDRHQGQVAEEIARDYRNSLRKAGFRLRLRTRYGEGAVLWAVPIIPPCPPSVVVDWLVRDLEE